MRDKKQILVLVLLTLLAVVLGVTYANWRKNHLGKIEPTATSASAPVKSKKTPHTPEQAVATVQNAYTVALAEVQKSRSSNQGEIDSIKPYLEEQLYQTLSTQITNGVQRDPLFCAQAIPDTITASLKSHTASTATVLVHEAFTASPIEVVVTVNLSTLKISAISCS